MKQEQLHIADLDNVVDSLTEEKKELFQRIFAVHTTIGYLNPPPSMHGWVEHQFGSVEAVTRQKVTKVTNRITCEGTIFNGLRASRPVDIREKLHIEARIINGAKEAKENLLHNPYQSTPEDLFGRVKGKHCLTASNISKYEGLHGMIVFDDHNPLHFSKEKIEDYLDTAWKWAKIAHARDTNARYFLFIWNCLQRAGASLSHGHAQVMLGRDSHYAKIEGLRQAARCYKAEHGTDYFDDLYRAHLSVGCALEIEGVRALAYLTPIKEREVMLLARSFTSTFKEMVHEVLACFRDRMRVTSFNLMIVTPPLDKVEGWEDFPVIARAVDRGYPHDPSCDFGTMELYAASVVSSDPFEVARTLKESLRAAV